MSANAAVKKDMLQILDAFEGRCLDRKPVRNYGNTGVNMAERLEGVDSSTYISSAFLYLAILRKRNW